MRQDSRKTTNGESLRKFWSVDGLIRQAPANRVPATNAYIYETQASVNMLGIDDRTYKVFATLDSYYEPESEDSVDAYHRDGSPQYAWDPLSRRARDFSRPVWDGRLYFLTTWDAFLDKAVLEWGDVIRVIREAVEARCVWPISLRVPQKSTTHWLTFFSLQVHRAIRKLAWYTGLQRLEEEDEPFHHKVHQSFVRHSAGLGRIQEA